jgi:ribosome-binding protein aMBF1 (putative translation factor)
VSERWRGTAMLERQDESAAARQGGKDDDPSEAADVEAPSFEVAPGDEVRAAALRNGIAVGWLVKRAGAARPGDASVPDPLAVRIGEEIGNRRQQLGMSQHDLARAIGCDRSAVSRWEMGLRLPSVPHLIAIGRALGCGARALLPE